MKFKDIIKLQRGSSPRPIIEYLTTSDDGVNWIKIGDMPISGRIVTSTEEKITKEGAKKSRHVSVGDLILSNSMSYGLPYIMGIDWYIHDGWFVLKNYEKTFDRDYLCNLLISDAIQRQYKKLAAGGVVQNISSDLVNSVYVSIPCLCEQKKIAKLLNLIDERIATQNKIIEDLKKLKSAISQIIFSNANLVKIQNLCEVIMGQSPSSSSYNSNNDGLPLIQGNLDIFDGVTISRIYTNEPTKISLQNDLILTVRAPVGIIAENKMEVCIGRGVCALRNKSAIPTMYIYYALDYFSYKWKQIEQGSTFTSINGDDVKNFAIPLVDAAEYSCTFLSKVDTLIKCSIDLHSNYIKQKQYLLRQMFI